MSKGEAIKYKVTLKDPWSIPGLDYYNPTPFELQALPEGNQI